MATLWFDVLEQNAAWLHSQSPSPLVVVDAVAKQFQAMHAVPRCPQLSFILLDQSRRAGALLQLVCGYAERFSSMLAGTCPDLPTTELAGGARVRHIFTHTFATGVRDVNPTRDLSDDDIRTAIRNSAGVSGALAALRFIRMVSLTLTLT